MTIPDRKPVVLTRLAMWWIERRMRQEEPPHLHAVINVIRDGKIRRVFCCARRPAVDVEPGLQIELMGFSPERPVKSIVARVLCDWDYFYGETITLFRGVETKFDDRYLLSFGWTVEETGRCDP